MVKIKEVPVKNEGNKKVIQEYLKYNNASGTAQSRWWLDKPEDMFQSVTAVTNAIQNNQTYKESSYLRYARLYSNMEIMGFGAGLYDRASTNTPVTNRVSYNVIKSCIDTAASKIAQMKPRIVSLTSGGSWKMQKQAEQLSKFLEGTFYEAKVWENMQRAFTDACVFGTGALKFFHDGQCVKTERVFIGEILTDSQEGVYGKPRQLHQIKYLSRDVLIDMFPEHAQKIATAQAGRSGVNTSLSTADFVVVRESWHLRSGKKAKDGRHAITIDNCTLFSERYDYDYFPFIFLRWSQKLLGFEGSGIAEELIGIQIEINKLLRNIQQAQNLACVPRVLIESGSSVVEDHISNKIGSIIKYTGTRPDIVTASAMPGEIYAHLETLFNKAYQIVGISSLSAASKKPGGLDSAVAIREYQDIETERFALVAQMYENAHVDLGNKLLDLCQEIAEIDPKYEVTVPGSKYITKIKWKDLKLSKNDYILQLYPASLLPTQPAGRLQKVQELLQAGMINQTTAKSLLQFPDVEDAMDNELAAYNDINAVLEDILDTDIYQAPEPFMNPQLCLSITQSKYLRAKTAKIEEEKLELLRRFMEDSAALLAAANPPAPEAPADPALAVPEALPASDLLPQV